MKLKANAKTFSNAVRLILHDGKRQSLQVKRQRVREGERSCKNEERHDVREERRRCEGPRERTRGGKAAVYERRERERSNVRTSENYNLYAALNQPSKIIPVQPAAIMNM